MSGSTFTVTHHAVSSETGRTADGNGSHGSTSKAPSYTKSVSWEHYLHPQRNPDSRKLLVFTLAVNKDFTETQRKHYVRIINSFIPAETPLSSES
ncbi:hypothetical protein [Erwinia aphidicola]|uniref:hypothetical protein n=1 Tax=Erwinia aphidicola TaxID=68334 RepID=UPI003BB1F7D1